MGTLVGPVLSAFTTSKDRPLFRSPTASLPSSKPHLTTSRKTHHHEINTSRFGNFLHLKPESKPGCLDSDLPWFNTSDRPCFDVIIIGTGPGGLRLAEQVSQYGIKVKHEEFESTIQCDDGSELKASLIIDASGFSSSFVEYDKPRNYGYQIAHGIFAEVDSHPFDLDKMVLMDWRDSHLGNEPYLRVNNSKLATFLYAMPFDSNLIFLEETSLVSRPVLSYSEIKRRMEARLRHLGIRVRKVIEDEKCLIPMGGPLPRIPQNVMAIGGISGVVHPSTGYMVARTMALAPLVAEAIAECLGSTRMIRGRPLYHKVWNGLWPIERRLSREFCCFGMETLLKLDLVGTRNFFEAFFDLDPYYWHGFLSSRLSLHELASFSLSLFGHASNSSRLDIMSKCPVPLVRMLGNLALQVI
ncbi:capsanthin/capsorubin synthase, chromoplastic-like isoform X2 [Gossypium arboreum]|uniref:capsanthin/capsorubin synthase, chromoplastic-like isoform X2 n=1 Tax=Gossypium arboreum TaxID=29729 RepID=UPI0008192C89|nr:capsanthin/capsorubin synthase, chromoplastic-like isoform X2 [Gossypium arboreum]